MNIDIKRISDIIREAEKPDAKTGEPKKMYFKIEFGKNTEIGSKVVYPVSKDNVGSKDFVKKAEQTIRNYQPDFLIVSVYKSPSDKTIPYLHPEKIIINQQNASNLSGFSEFSLGQVPVNIQEYLGDKGRQIEMNILLNTANSDLARARDEIRSKDDKIRQCEEKNEQLRIQIRDMEDEEFSRNRTKLTSSAVVQGILNGIKGTKIEQYLGFLAEDEPTQPQQLALPEASENMNIQQRQSFQIATNIFEWMKNYIYQNQNPAEMFNTLHLIFNRINSDISTIEEIKNILGNKQL